MTINELIEKRATLWKAMDAFLKAQVSEKGVSCSTSFTPSRTENCLTS